jgi:hypothetical protein
MVRHEDELIQSDVSDWLAAELPVDAAQIRSMLRMAKSRWPAPCIPLKPGAGPKTSPRALRAWSPS